MNLIPKRRFEGTPTDFGSQTQRSITEFKKLTIGTAQIGDASITDAKITTCSITKLTTGNLTVAGIVGTGGSLGTAASGARVEIIPTGIKWYDATTQRGQILNDGSGWLGSSTGISWTTAGALSVSGTITAAGFVTGVSPNARIEITSSLIAGYSDATTKQFYLQASDGKGYFGTGGCVLDVLGLTINNATIATAALRFVNGAGVLSTVYQYSDGDLNIQADSYLLLGGDSARVNFNCGIAPVVPGSFNNGTTGLYWNEFYYKVLSDQGCPSPVIPSALNAIKNMKTKKRKLTLEDVEKEDMGSRARDRVLKNEGGEFEEIDKDSYPDELLVKPKESDYEQAKKDYEGNVAKAKERGKDWTKIKEYPPKIGLCTNELVYMHTKAIQELIGRLEVLEEKV